MKYLYYIAAIIVAFSVLAAFWSIDTKVKISEPLIVVNDRIITESEYKKLLPSKPYYMTEAQYIESIIEKQLLIQEAVRQNINKEESFRKSVENYYEQSLIKILLDRNQKAITVNVTKQELERYQSFSQSRAYISKLLYKTMEEALAGENPTLHKIESDFMDIPGDLKFIVFNLKKGQSSAPFVFTEGVIVYRLEDIKQMNADKSIEIDLKKISLFIQDKKKELLMEGWSKNLRKNAKIRRY